MLFLSLRQLRLIFFALIRYTAVHASCIGYSCIIHSRTAVVICKASANKKYTIYDVNKYIAHICVIHAINMSQGFGGAGGGGESGGGDGGGGEGRCAFTQEIRAANSAS